MTESTPETKGSNWTLANLFTSARILLILPFLYYIYSGRFGVALTIFFIASITDFIDGYLARNYGQQSRLGQFLDPAADKLLTTASYVVLAIPNDRIPHLPFWLTFAVVGRDVLILIGSLIVYRMTRYKDFKPTALGRLNTFLEMGLIFWFLVFHAANFWTGLLPYLYFVVLASILLTSGEYLIQGAKILRQHQKKSA